MAEINAAVGIFAEEMANESPHVRNVPRRHRFDALTRLTGRPKLD
jgi:hypothetical protein